MCVRRPCTADESCRGACAAAGRQLGWLRIVRHVLIQCDLLGQKSDCALWQLPSASVRGMGAALGDQHGAPAAGVKGCCWLSARLFMLWWERGWFCSHSFDKQKQKRALFCMHACNHTRTSYGSCMIDCCCAQWSGGWAAVSTHSGGQ